MHAAGPGLYLCNLTDQALERQLADQQLGGLLVLPDLTQGDGSGPVPVRLLDTACVSHAGKHVRPGMNIVLCGYKVR